MKDLIKTAMTLHQMKMKMMKDVFPEKSYGQLSPKEKDVLTERVKKEMEKEKKEEEKKTEKKSSLDIAKIAANYLKFQQKMLKEKYKGKYKSPFQIPEKERKTFMKEVSKKWKEEKGK